jgi:hypothetical protein
LTPGTNNGKEDEDLEQYLDPENRKNQDKNPFRAVATHRAQAQQNAREREEPGWVDQTIVERARTYSLVLEVTKQLKKLEALSERLGSEGNGGGH